MVGESTSLLTCVATVAVKYWVAGLIDLQVHALDKESSKAVTFTCLFATTSRALKSTGSRTAAFAVMAARAATSARFFLAT